MESHKGGIWSYHDADVVSVVQRQGSVHLQQVVLRPQEAVQVLRVETHQEGNVVQTTKGCKRILKYRLRPGVHFTNLKNLRLKTKLMSFFFYLLQTFNRIYKRSEWSRTSFSGINLLGPLPRGLGILTLKSCKKKRKKKEKGLVFILNQ